MAAGMSISTLSKRIFLTPLIAGLALFAVIPSSAEAATSKVPKAQLTTYMNQLKPLAASETSILKRYDSVTGKNYKDDLTTFTMMQKILPDVNKYIMKLEAIQPSNATLRKIHQGYIDAWNAQAEGFTLIMSALQNSDYTALAAGNKALSKGRTLMYNFSTSLKAIQ
jgi:hypothetical protein